MSHKCQARLARGVEAEGIAGKLYGLCRGLGTEAGWNANSCCLEIDRMEPPAPAARYGLRLDAALP
jgi:hypothetical protein